VSGSIVLVTSGLGSRFGGVGVVSSLLVSAIGPPRVRVWRHHHTWPSLARRGALAARALIGGLARPTLVVYEHIGLAAMHRIVPTLRGVPYVVFLHGTEVWRPLDEGQQAAAMGAALLLVNSEFTLRAAREVNPWLPAAQVVHLGVPLPRSDPARAGPRKPQALLVGRMARAERYKGHDQVLEAWPRIRAAVPAASLVIVGGGDDEERIRGMARGVDGVEFLGRVSDSERDRLYAESRVILFPSLREGFGLVAVEAAAHSAAIVGLRGTVIEELFPGGDGPSLAESQRPEAIAAATIPLLVDPAEAERRAASGLARVHATFLEEHAVERMRQALQEWTC
jgi:phosphatidylinositol alpha-1,6-mannosyltransferase